MYNATYSVNILTLGVNDAMQSVNVFTCFYRFAHTLPVRLTDGAGFSYYASTWLKCLAAIGNELLD